MRHNEVPRSVFQADDRIRLLCDLNELGVANELQVSAVPSRDHRAGLVQQGSQVGLQFRYILAELANCAGLIRGFGANCSLQVASNTCDHLRKLDRLCDVVDEICLLYTSPSPR